MPADRLLNTVLKYYQDVHDPPKTDQIIGTTTQLLAQLSNPLNLSLLTSQLLTARAIWHRQDGPRTAIRIIGIYHTAAARVRDHEMQNAKHAAASPMEGTREANSGLRCDAWARAVVKGADERSRRWQHLLVLTGILVGMEGNNRRALSSGLRSTLEQAVVTAANLALDENVEDGLPAAASIVTALNFAFPLLSDHRRAQINCNALLPMAVWAITAEEGFCDGQFLKAIARDTTETAAALLHWPATSPSSRLLQDMDKQPLMANVGPLAKLAGFAVQHATDTAAVLQAHDALAVFTSRLLDCWARNPLSGVDAASEGTCLTADTLQNTWPLLWQVLRKLLYGTVAVLHAIVSRSLLDPRMLAHGMAPGVSATSLHILRNLYFISSRNGNGAFQVYTFSYLTSIDVLSKDAAATDAFLRELRPGDASSVPVAPFQRMLDLFYLNVAEHLPLSLSVEACENLIIKPAMTYISYDGPMTPSMAELFESAHSAILSVLCCPQHSPLTIQVAPFYIVKLFESFPDRMSPRQFRVAFKTVMEIVSPPFPIAAMDPHLSETLLEMLRTSIAAAPAAPLDPSANQPPHAGLTQQDEVPMSVQSSLVMALVDSLPFLPLPLVEEWLTVTAQTMNGIADPRLRAPVKSRFWDVLVNGEMDVERSTMGVAWWGTKGGRELVLSGERREEPMMSGALVRDGNAGRL
ncbi:peroxisomal membrane protein Pex17 [Drechmeria coniospora]|uniref:Peroxisomal membrane protein Pex17 n=1 Tax=Drechmeria coniospora TaxID=98403 RepID=A0A151GT02_DRECN|nr:peroxisomal membrane protein Pex17 [Drechmeria coniospora]KYK60132.1 peroxisomal membrane protein Pex17 [Drechmeria coniospora]